MKVGFTHRLGLEGLVIYNRKIERNQEINTLILQANAVKTCENIFCSYFKTPGCFKTLAVLKVIPRLFPFFILAFVWLF